MVINGHFLKDSHVTPPILFDSAPMGNVQISVLGKLLIPFEDLTIWNEASLLADIRYLVIKYPTHPLHFIDLQKARFRLHRLYQPGLGQSSL